MSSQAVQDEAERDRLIEEASQEYPEYSWADEAQERIYAEAHERGPAMSYPEFEGPGYTEPAVNGPENHVDHTEQERDHYWDQEADLEAEADHSLGAGLEEGPQLETWHWSDEKINAVAREFEDAEPPENDPEAEADTGYPRQEWLPEQAHIGGFGPEEGLEPDAEGFARYYGEPPTPTVDREPGE